MYSGKQEKKCRHPSKHDGFYTRLRLTHVHITNVDEKKIILRRMLNIFVYRILEINQMVHKKKRVNYYDSRSIKLSH